MAFRGSLGVKGLLSTKIPEEVFSLVARKRGGYHLIPLTMY